ncbi:MAG TPA: DoxX family protein [Terracidiphilus sp.]|jgi:hypothetical protein|nr:DoxX family protein [Terracidiphilus sp.]
MNLKSARWTFWLTTTLFCAAMAFSAVLYLTNAGFKERFAHLGFPSYFRVELAVFKLAGVFALLLPARVPMKEWAYAGFFITLISASLAHFESGDSTAKVMNPILTAVLLTASYFSYRKLNQGRHYIPAVDKED